MLLYSARRFNEWQKPAAVYKKYKEKSENKDVLERVSLLTQGIFQSLIGTHFLPSEKNPHSIGYLDYLQVTLLCAYLANSNENNNTYEVKKIPASEIFNNQQLNDRQIIFQHEGTSPNEKINYKLKYNEEIITDALEEDSENWHQLPQRNSDPSATQKSWLLSEIQKNHNEKDPQNQIQIYNSNNGDNGACLRIIPLVLLIIPEMIIRYTLATLITIVTLPVVLTMALTPSCADVETDPSDEEAGPEPQGRNSSDEEDDDEFEQLTA